MSSPVLRGAKGFNNGASAVTTLSVTFPTSLAVGDLMFIWVTEGGSTAVTWTCSAPVSGSAFTAVTETAGASNQAQLLYKTADSQDAANAAASTAYTVTCSVAHLVSGIAGAYSNVAGFDPVPTTSGQANTSSTTLGAPGVTTVSSGDILVWLGCTSTGSGGAPAVITQPAGFTAETVQSNSNTTSGSGTNSGMLMADSVQGAAGATGAENGTLATAHTSVGLLFALSGSATGGGAGSARPGKTWLRRFHHRQQFSLPAQPLAPFTVVQTSPTVHLTAAGPATATLGSPTGTGNTLVACINANGATANPVATAVTLGGVADHWASVVANNPGVASDAQIWYDPNCAGGQTSIVVTFGTAGSGTIDEYLTVYEVSGVLAADQTVTADNSGTPTTWSSGATGTTAVAAEIFFGALISDSSTLPVATGVGTWTTQGSAGTYRQLAGFQIVAATGTATYSGTQAAGSYSVAVATFSAGTGTATGAAAIAGAGTVTAAVTQGVIAAPAGAGAVSAVATVIAPVTVTGAGAAAAVVTQAAPATLAGAGAAGPVPVTQAVTAALAAAGTVTAVATQIATASITGAGAVADVVTEIAGATLTGAGVLTATGTSGGAPTASLAGAASLTAVATVAVTATAAGAGTVTATTVQAAGAPLTGAGAVTAKATQAAIATAAGAGAVTATATQAAKATLTGAGALTAAGAITGTATLAAAGTLTGKATQGAGATPAGAGTLTALAVQGATAAAAAAGTVTAVSGTTTAFTVGSLTASGAPAAVLTAAGATSALTAATAPSGALTAADQRTGGPG